MPEAKPNPVMILVEAGYEARYVMDVEGVCDLLRAIAGASGTFTKNYQSGAKFKFEEGIKTEITLTIVDQKTINKMKLEDKLQGE